MVDRGMKATSDEIQTMVLYLQTNFGRDSDSTPTSSAASSK
jgi:hypothetical protein